MFSKRRRGFVSKRGLSAREEGGVGVVSRGRRRGGSQQGREGGGEEEERGLSTRVGRRVVSNRENKEEKEKEGRESETFRVFVADSGGDGNSI